MTVTTMGRLAGMMMALTAVAACSDSSTRPLPSDGNGDDSGDGGGCWVRLYDGDNYTDDSFVIRGAGRYGDLSRLEGADKDWTREADSFKLGPEASMTTWSEADFGGTSAHYDRGAEEPDAEHEPGSLELTCG